MQTSTNDQTNDPQTLLGRPIWFHPHGSKMGVAKIDTSGQALILSSSAAGIVIRKASMTFPNTDGWFVDWEIVQFKPYDELIRGRVLFDDDDLRAAFGLFRSIGDDSKWLAERFGAHAVEQGKYIRWNRFLNIPGPGTGHDGDPNISIELDQTILDAVSNLMS